MLNKNEKAVMEFIYKKCQSVGNCLTSLQEIIISLSHKIKLTETTLKTVIESLEQEDYIDVIYSDRQGQPVICITLHLKGKAYPREAVQSERQIKYKLLLASIGAVISFVIGRILYLIFT